MSDFHKSVLLQEAIVGLNVRPGEKYIDATLGGGGHSRLITENGGLVLGIDQDEEAIEYIKKNFQLRIVQGNFAQIGKIAKEKGFSNAAGILFDLGVSGHQLESGERGFSFLKDAPLDMRMDKGLGVTASDLINGFHKGELEELFRRYGEEPFARSIAEKITEERLKEKILTTRQLADLVANVYQRQSKIHPATKVFQALRIAVNDELASLEKALPQALSLVKSNGRIVVISFHSLEDRIVKQRFRIWEEKGFGKVLTKKPVIPSIEEVNVNPRSRSAKMRIFENI